MVGPIYGLYVPLPNPRLATRLRVWRDEELGACIDRCERVFLVAEYSLKEFIAMGIFDGCLPSNGDGKSATEFTDSKFMERWPTVGAFMCKKTGDDGKTRTTSTLLIFTEDGVAKGTLRERDHNCALWVSAPSILGVLDALEEALGERPVPWRKSTESNGYAKRR